jgi:uncharacterized protein YcbX
MQVSELYHYPVKSCAAVAVESVVVGPLGFAGDRKFMLIDAQGLFLSQRSHPTMALIIPSIAADGLRLSAPGRTVYHHETVLDGENARAKLIADTIAVMDQGDGVAQWFSDYLHIDCRLVYANQPFTRGLPPQFGDRLERNSQRFFDAAPLLVINEASLADFNAVLAEPVAMARFRPNIVISGAAAGTELNWGELALGDVLLNTIAACERCELPNVNPETGAADQDVYKALREHLPRLPDRYYSGVPFGAYMAVLNGGELQRGTAISRN